MALNPDALVVRARIVRAIRAFFDGQGFVEVETPVRIAAPAPEEHIDCPVVLGQPSSVAGEAAKGDFTYLRASPELQMKKLLAAGMDRLYQIGPCFREGEKGTRHNPEFTMIEWYRRNATYLDIADDLERLWASVSASVGAVSSPRPIVDAVSSPRPEKESASISDAEGTPRLHHFRRLRVRDAYREFAGWDPWEGAWDQDRFDFDMATKIEPALKDLGGVFLMDYPPQAASLARLSSVPPVQQSNNQTIQQSNNSPVPPVQQSNNPTIQQSNNSPVPPIQQSNNPTIQQSNNSPVLPIQQSNNPTIQQSNNSPVPPIQQSNNPTIQQSNNSPVPPIQQSNNQTIQQSNNSPYAERWEFYWNGLELANCFSELCDGAEQRARFEKAKAARRELGESDYPIDEAFLDAVPRMGSAAGVALGVDRLVMVLTGAKSIADVRLVEE